MLRHIRYGALKITYWDGQTVTYGTGKPYNHIIVKSPKAIRAILKNMSLGFGESYMNGLIDIKGPLDGPVRLVAKNKHIFRPLAINRITRLRQRNTKRRQARQIQHHYDIGNDFYKLWLDKSMTYTCAYFRNANDSLEKAQRQKIEHVLKKLQLHPGQSLLDIGSGWGSLLITAAKQYGTYGLGVTLSKEQYAHATKAAKKAKVDHLVQFKLMNYQDVPSLNKQFDRIVSVGMFEAVGRHNLKTYYRLLADLLKPGGISVLHTITQEREISLEPWLDKYIFPGGYIPSYRQVVKAFPKYNFRLVDYENLRIHYAMTLDHWLDRFEHHKKDVLKMYDERFYRMWKFYLASSSGSFRYWDMSLSQFVFTKGLNNDLPLTRERLYR